MELVLCLCCRPSGVQTVYDGIEHKPETTFGNVKAICNCIGLDVNAVSINSYCNVKEVSHDIDIHIDSCDVWPS
jgi:hypothetical protein